MSDPTRPENEKPQRQPSQCGPECWTPDALHAEPEIDWIGDFPLAHGESERPVPGTGGWNGVYTETPDAYCLCGHPNYATCPRWLSEGIMSLTIEPGGGLGV